MGLVGSAIVALRIGFELLIFKDVPGPTGPGVGAALLIGGIIVAACIGVFVFCWRHRPSNEVLNFPTIAASLLCICVVAGGLWHVAHNSGNYNLVIQFLDASGVPLASEKVLCNAMNNGRWPYFGPDHNGEKILDSKGRLSLKVSRTQSILFYFQKSGFKTASVEFGAIFNSISPHHELIVNDAKLEFATGAALDMRSMADRDQQICRIPIADEIRVIVKLKPVVPDPLKKVKSAKRSTPTSIPAHAPCNLLSLFT